MRRTTLAASLAALVLLAEPAGAREHPCAKDAGAAALKLLRLHTDADDRASLDPERARQIGTVKALTGKGGFDVLELEGYVYKASYRIRLIYAKLPDACILMGQEILERGNPY